MSSKREVGDALGHVLDHYVAAKTNDTITKSHAVCKALDRAAQLIQVNGPLKSRANILVRWSAGQGRWATVPWIAVMDSRETSRTSSGVYVIYLFRADMSAVYLTLNQGISALMERSSSTMLEELQRRKLRLREKCAPLVAKGFDARDGIDLRNTSALVRGYQASTVAHRQYDRGHLPPDESLLDDLGIVVELYQKLVPSSRLLERRGRVGTSEEGDSE